MGIMSYAQNFEDVMLWRALGDVTQGFWIDVGAADPVRHSVTCAFSEHGWHGVNVEPSPAAFVRLQAARPRDVNLSVALAGAPGRLTFFDCEDSTLSTLDPAIAERNRAEGRLVQEREVEVTTLAELCRQHAPADIHFLKIDVEGAEAQVLAGADFTRFRPWIVVVESTIPLTQTDNSLGWEPMLLQAGYVFVWFDGLNRFYVAGERMEALAKHFRAPANVFDGYVLFDRGTGPAAEADTALPMPVPAAHAVSARTRAVVLARMVRSFLGAELRQEIDQLRREVMRLAVEIEGLRRSVQKP